MTTPDPREEIRALIANIEPGSGKPVLGGPIAVPRQPGVFETEDDEQGRGYVLDSTADVPSAAMATLDDGTAKAAQLDDGTAAAAPSAADAPVIWLTDEVAEIMGTEPANWADVARAARKTAIAPLDDVLFAPGWSKARPPQEPNRAPIPRPARVPSRRVRRNIHRLAGQRGLSPVGIVMHYAERGRSYNVDVIRWVLRRRNLA